MQYLRSQYLPIEKHLKCCIFNANQVTYRTRIIALHFSGRINFCANRERAFYFLTLPLTFLAFVRGSVYSRGILPLISRYVPSALWSTIVGFSSYSGNHTNRQIHTRLSTACFCVSQPAGWHRGIRGAVYLPNQTNLTTFIRGFLYRGVRQWRIKPPTQVRRAIARKSKTYIGVPSPLRSRLSVFVNGSW